MHRLAAALLYAVALPATVAVTDQERTMVDYAMGVRFAACSTAAWDASATESFRAALASRLGAYCRSRPAACMLRAGSGAEFAAEHVAILEGYPDASELYAVELRYVVMYPPGAALAEGASKFAFVERSVLSEFMSRHMESVAAGMGRRLLSMERWPKYDGVTEFMNIALLPIGILIAVAMYATAFCATSLNFELGTDMVAGSSGGKNVAAERIKQMIETQKRAELQAQALQAQQQHELEQARGRAAAVAAADSAPALRGPPPPAYKYDGIERVLLDPAALRHEHSGGGAAPRPPDISVQMEQSASATAGEVGGGSADGNANALFVTGGSSRLTGSFLDLANQRRGSFVDDLRSALGGAGRFTMAGGGGYANYKRGSNVGYAQQYAGGNSGRAGARPGAFFMMSALSRR